MDAVAAQAGITKRTLYHHFRSKDDPDAAYLDGRDQPNRMLFQRWFNATEGGLAEKVRSIFTHLAASARHPKWKGCGFLRTTAELAHMPGHPAIKVGAGHKKRFEAWMRGVIEAERIGDGPPRRGSRREAGWSAPGSRLGRVRQAEQPYAAAAVSTRRVLPDTRMLVPGVGGISAVRRERILMSSPWMISMEPPCGHPRSRR